MDFIQKLLIAVNDFKDCSPNRVGYLIFLAHRLSTELAIGVRHTDKLNCHLISREKEEELLKRRWNYRS